ncbi:unnamed protein product [Pylaiella littoralis]
MRSSSAVNMSEKVHRQQQTKLLLLSTTRVGLVLLCTAVVVLLGETPAVRGLEMEPMRDGCLQVTFEAGDHIKTDPRCIVSRGVGLALRPPATLDRTGILKGLKRRLRGANGQDDRRDKDPLQRLSNTMASNTTNCYLAPPFPGGIALLSVSGGKSEDETEDESESESKRESHRAASPSPSSSGRSGRPHTADGRRERPTRDRGSGRSSSSRKAEPAASRQRKRSRLSAMGHHDNSGNPQRLVLLTQAIVAVGPEVVVQPLPSGGRGRGRPLSHHQRGGTFAGVGALSVCEGCGPVALAGCGKIKKLRLRPGQKLLVDTLRAVGWTSGVMRLGDPGGSTSRSSGGGGGGRSSNVASLSAVSTFVGPGTVYVQTHSLASLRRLLLPKPGMGGSRHGGVSPGFLGIGERGTVAPSPRHGAVMGLSLKRGLAKRVKAAARRVAVTLAFCALYLVVYSLATALLLDGKDGLVKAPRHAIQVVRSLVNLARRVAMVLVRLGQEELWRNADGPGGGLLQEGSVER